ncbi:hypothetical protein GOP47_0010540 [Adiantum capillus-veneris]|uniref:ABC transporter domain-containing protein n=1 Tax=Adiantum capillus-veneris TaxID=13818 RepID=A0A9D4UVI0_ADICA|nr:hypothetical protein GOP47_0010540 [Adiantum capillus-veneris]
MHAALGFRGGEGAAFVVTVETKELSFTYPGIDGYPPPHAPPLIRSFSLTLRSGDRCLLVGANGAGKTTILKLLGGKHMVEPEMVRVLGRSAFHDTALTSSGDLSYLGGEWRRDVAFAGFDVPLQMDLSAEKMIFGVQGIDPDRRNRLIKVLDIDLNWRLHKVSDGQRRRVQICMGLLRPFKVLLLDEITVDLDVLARADLLAFLLSDKIDFPAVTLQVQAYVAQGTLQFVKPLSDFKELKETSLMRLVESWLRKEIEDGRMKRKEKRERGGASTDLNYAANRSKVFNNGWAGGRLHSTRAGFDMWYGTPTISVESWPVTLSATKYMAYRFCGLEVTVMSTFACSIDSALHVGWILVTGDKSSTTETDWIRCSSRGLLLAQPFGIRTNVSAKLPNLAL